MWGHPSTPLALPLLTMTTMTAAALEASVFPRPPPQSSGRWMAPPSPSALKMSTTPHPPLLLPMAPPLWLQATTMMRSPHRSCCTLQVVQTKAPEWRGLLEASRRTGILLTTITTTPPGRTSMSLWTTSAWPSCRMSWMSSRRSDTFLSNLTHRSPVRKSDDDHVVRLTRALVAERLVTHWSCASRSDGAHNVVTSFNFASRFVGDCGDSPEP